MVEAADEIPWPQDPLAPVSFYLTLFACSLMHVIDSGMLLFTMIAELPMFFVLSVSVKVGYPLSSGPC